MRKEFKEIIENEFDCLVNDVDFVIKKEGNLETLLKCMEQAFSLNVVSHRRELLIAYEKNHYSFHEWIVLKNQCIRDIDEYLSN